MNKKVSIIVPVYGVEAWLERCLESLVNQTLEDIEIIVVNDGSPDNSQEIIDRYTAKYPDKVFGYIKENGGLSDARNYGMQYATGEFLAFVTATITWTLPCMKSSTTKPWRRTPKSLSAPTIRSMMPRRI